MSSNKTIKALREERTLLYAEIRRLQVAAAGTVMVPATGIKELKVQRGRVAVAFEFPSFPEKLSASFREHLQTDPAAFARYYLGEFKAPEPDWTQAPPDASHALAKDPEHIFWLKLGRDHEPAEIWLPDRFEWAKTVATSGERRQSPHVVARPAPEEKWSLNGENGSWDYNTLAELLKDYSPDHVDAGPHGSYNSDAVYEGSVVFRSIACKDDPAGFLPDEDHVLEHMSERAYDSDAGEWADNYPELDESAKADLATALEPLKTWARKHCQPDFFTVKGITPYTVTAEDVGVIL